MMKRKKDEDDGSEMDVDDEHKAEQNESVDEDEMDDDDEDSNDDEEEEVGAMITEKSEESPFLDSFYGLSSADPRERANASQVMLDHCLVGPNANTKDATYAFRRLLNGVCSGRACARQGNASALSSFLKISFHLGKMEEIRTEQHSDGDEMDQTSLLGYVRWMLLQSTDPSQTTGKKRGSEERDYYFGRLFGILAVVRSNILLPKTVGDIDPFDVIDVSSALASDLVELFWLKKWMREPAAHGISLLMASFYGVGNTEIGKKVTKQIVEQVVIPKILHLEGGGEESESTRMALLENYSAEQIALATTIQSHVHLHPSGLPFPLDKPVVCVGTLPRVAKSLSETSVVVQPRMHFVWDAIWMFLTEDDASTESGSKTGRIRRRLRQSCPIGDDSPLDTLDAIIQHVLCEQLLRIDKNAGKFMVNTTHERRSLALCLVRNLCGVTFASTLSGPMQIRLEPDALEINVLTQDIVRSLFIDVICAGNQKKQTTHLLKPLALQVLASITESLTGSNDSISSQDGIRLACIRALSNCEIRFDARTKTTTISDLLMFAPSAADRQSLAHLKTWSEYIDYLEHQVLAKSATKGQESAALITGYVELLYSTTKSILRVETPKESNIAELGEFKYSVIRRVQSFLMICGFFKCEGFSMKSGKKKKKKGQKGEKSNDHPIVQAATKLKDSGASLPYAVRTVISARFFSLVAEHVNYATHDVLNLEKERKLEKDTRILEIISDLVESWKLIESAGAARYLPTPDKEGGDEDDPEKLMATFQKRVRDLTAPVDAAPRDNLVQPKKRCATGIAALAYSVYLHRLNCGSQVDVMENDDPDADFEDDEEEIMNSIEELHGVLEGFLEAKDDDNNSLLGLAGSCANILSSPLGSGNLGRASSPRLVREAVKFAWLGGLSLSATMSSSSSTLLDSNVVKVLLEACGTSNEDPTDEDEADAEEDSHDEEDASGNDAVFSAASGMIGHDDDDDDMEVEQKEQETPDSDSEVELDPSKLQSLLEDDSDAGIDAGELEHHEGADAALAKLIKLKQDTRKEAQQAREKLEISNQLRCTFLLELLFVRPESWNHLFRSDVILGTLVPMLKYRREIEKSLEKAKDKGSNVANGEKSALLDRLTTLLKSKLCKMRLAATPCTPSVNFAEYASLLLAEVMELAKRGGTKEHSSCCSLGMVLVLRSIPDPEDKIKAAEIYNDAVVEWSSKRATRLQTSLFDDFISHMPSLAQVTLLPSLSNATHEARGPFLKVEAFRLLSLLLSTKLDPQSSSDLDQSALSQIRDHGTNVIDAVAIALENDEMCRAKRVRVVLKAMEKFLSALSSAVAKGPNQIFADGLTKISKLLKKIESSESNAVQTTCTKLQTEIETLIKALSVPAETPPEPTATPTGSAQTTGSSIKSPKSKKKKKKKK